MKLNKIFNILILGNFLLIGCENKTNDSEKIEKIKFIVKDMLTDGDSAKFTDLKYFPSTKFGCGMVNAKNKFGGYAGKKKFIVSLEKNFAEIEPDRFIPEGPRSPTSIDYQSAINYALNTEKWLKEADEIRNKFQAFDALINDKCPSSTASIIKNSKEYRVSHILVDTEGEAEALISSIKKGAKFEDLAKKKSKDPGSRSRGGDLDWAIDGSYVLEFSEAFKKLSKGEITEIPVKTQFGFHIIRLDDTR